MWRHSGGSTAAADLDPPGELLPSLPCRPRPQFRQLLSQVFAWRLCKPAGLFTVERSVVIASHAGEHGQRGCVEGAAQGAERPASRPRAGGRPAQRPPRNGGRRHGRRLGGRRGPLCFGCLIAAGADSCMFSVVASCVLLARRQWAPASRVPGARWKTWQAPSIHVLCCSNGRACLSCSGPLPQGFPRADVDVAAIRADRHAIISEPPRAA